MTETAIQAKGLKKSFRQLHVLKGVDFEVERGCIFALLGSNGAGKTTVVRILTTLLKQDGGTATVNGFDVASRPDSVRQSISLTGQFAAVDEILTGRENLVMIARLRHLGNPRQIADDLLNRFGLTDAADRRGVHLFRRHAQKARHRHGPRGKPANPVSGRANHGARSRGAHRGLEDGQGACQRAALRCS